MKLKIENIIDANTAVDLHPALIRFANIDLPVKTSFRLKGIVKQAIYHCNSYLAFRLELYKKHGEHNTETDMYSIPADKLAAFEADFLQLLDTDIEITGERFKLSEFYSSSSIRTNDLLALEWLIDDGQPVTAPATAEPAQEPAAADESTNDAPAPESNVVDLADVLDLNSKSDSAAA